MSRYPRNPTKNESKSKKEIRLLSNRLWKIISEYVRRRDGKCVCCDKTEHLQCGHYWHGWLDFHEINLNAQCSNCNNPSRGGGKIPEYTMYLVKKYGHLILNFLEFLKCLERRVHDKTGKLNHVGMELTPELLNRLIVYYQTKLAKLK